MNQTNITHVKVVKDPLFKRILTRPFKYYGRAAGWTFGLVAVSNLLTTVFDSDRRQFLQEHPQIYSMGLLGKSGYFGVLWPAFYLTAIKNPKSAFIYGGGLEQAANELDKMSNELEKIANELEKEAKKSTW